MDLKTVVVVKEKEKEEKEKPSLIGRSEMARAKVHTITARWLSYTFFSECIQKNIVFLFYGRHNNNCYDMLIVWIVRALLVN